MRSACSTGTIDIGRPVRQEQSGERRVLGDQVLRVQPGPTTSEPT
jgi:hypothetical protein